MCGGVGEGWRRGTGSKRAEVTVPSFEQEAVMMLMVGFIGILRFHVCCMNYGTYD